MTDQTANTAQRVAVESARERIKAARFDVEEGIDGLWRLAGQKEDMSAVALVLKDYAALLLQVAELEADATVARDSRDMWHGLYMEAEERVTAVETKLAEQAAEIALLRNGAERETLHMQTQLAAAERGREEACGLLREAQPRVRHSAGSVAGAIGAHYATEDYALLSRIAAFLAANGGV